MIVIFLLILLSIVIAGGFLAGFIWSVRSGQYEDTCTPSLRLLTDDPVGRSPQEIPGSRSRLRPSDEPAAGETGVHPPQYCYGGRVPPAVRATRSGSDRGQGSSTGVRESRVSAEAARRGDREQAHQEIESLL